MHACSEEFYTAYKKGESVAVLLLEDPTRLEHSDIHPTTRVIVEMNVIINYSHRDIMKYQ